MTTGWTAKTLERSRRLTVSFSLEGFIWEVGVGVGWGSRGPVGRGGVQAPFTGEPGLRLSSRVRSTFGLGLESGVLSLRVALGYRMETSLVTPASRDWIWTRFGPKSLVQTVFQRFGKSQLGGSSGVGRQGSGGPGELSEREQRGVPNGLCLGPGSRVEADALLRPELVLLPLVATASLPGRVRQGLHQPWHPPWQGLTPASCQLGSCIYDNSYSPGISVSNALPFCLHGFLGHIRSSHF